MIEGDLTGKNEIRDALRVQLRTLDGALVDEGALIGLMADRMVAMLIMGDPTYVLSVEQRQLGQTDSAKHSESD